MTDEQTPRSGSRWEPAPEDDTVAQPATPPEPPAATHAEAQAPAPAAPTRTWTERARGNVGLAGGALALVLVGGFGGFAVANAADGPDHFGLVGEQAPGGGFPAPGTGQLPPPPHGDDHGDGFGTPPGGSDDDGPEAESGSTL
jgi:hypothetical protein